MILSGRYYDGQSTQVVVLEARLTPEGINVRGTEYLLDDLAISPKLGRTVRFIDLPNGARLECQPQDALDELDRRLKTKSVLHRLESHWLAVMFSVLVAAVFIGWGAIYGVPSLAKSVAMSVPQDWVLSSDEYTLSALDKSLFDASELEENRKRVLITAFESLKQHSNIQGHLVFRSSKQGANAFALPGGTVVMTDELVALAKHDDEIIGVLAHELGHIRNRHSLRHTLQASALTLVLTAVTGDLTGLDSLLVNLPVVLMSMSYGRELESEADETAYALMQQLGLDHQHFANMMQRLHEGSQQGPKWLSSHPPSEERIARFED